ncbi:hypothetical protein BDV10DRAFT_202764 [Aspergillus recurvatus]
MEVDCDYSYRHSTRHKDYAMSLSGDCNHLEIDAKRELEKEILLNTIQEPFPAVENFQEVLRLFPPFRDDDGTTLGAMEVKCPDCDAVFSSETELNQHYLTRYCTGSAVAVYVMTRDRLITRGYRMEKRLLPLDARPIRFFCSYCERPFSPGDEIIDRQPKLSQSDEEELLAISFAGLFDLEKVHAPNGIYQSLPAGEMGLSDASSCSRGLGDGAMIETEKTDLCEDESRHGASGLNNSDGGLIDSRKVDYETRRSSKRQSFFQKLFGRKVPLSISGSRSTNRGKKLMKRANTIRFSFVTKYSRDSRATTTARDSMLPMDESQNNSSSTVQDAEYIALLRGTQNVFVHMQYISGGAIAHDVSGRQRILQVDEVAKLFLQIKDELSSTAVWSRALTTRLRGEALLKQGNAQGAVVEFHDAMKLLADTPGVDIEKQTRASILHSMGKAYQALDIPAEAEACYLESLGLYKRVLGRDHPKNFSVLHDLGSLCEKDGYATEAAALYERSFAGRLKTLGHNAPETLSSMQVLASLKVLLGDLESALLLLEKAVPALDTVFGIQNATTLNAMNKLSLLYQKLGLQKESRTICSRIIPHCRTAFGLSAQITRDAVLRYLQSLDNFDFPPDIQDVLDSYKRSRDTDCLRVIHRLGRSYMDAGLNRDAAALFETLVEDFLAVKGPEAAETFDALSALCVSREHLDSVDKAMLAYRQLVHMAKRTPEGHQSRKRIGYAEKRISELNRRREILEAERREWRLKEPGPCRGCGALTTVFCSTCNTTRFCSDTCANQSLPSHFPVCIPSVTLRESKSLAVKSRCPISARDQALSKISYSYSPATVNTMGQGLSVGMNMNMGLSIKNVVVIASYTFYLDPRNFATFRMKLNTNVNTVVLFSLDSDVEYAVLTTCSDSSLKTATGHGQTAEQPRGRISFSRPTTSSRRNVSVAIGGNAAPPHRARTAQTQTQTIQTPHMKEQQHQQELTWLTPQAQDSISHIPIPNPTKPNQHQHHPTLTTENVAQIPNCEEKYLLVKPGKEMHKCLLDKRLSVRSSTFMSSSSLDPSRNQTYIPNKELIEYAQGLLLTGYLGEAFMYVIEWVWR